MTVYVKIDRINGRNDFYNIVKSLNELGVVAEYYRGGWGDYRIPLSAPHLKFEDEEDALIYILKFGGELLKEIPTQDMQGE